MRDVGLRVHNIGRSSSLPLGHDYRTLHHRDPTTAPVPTTTVTTATAATDRTDVRVRVIALRARTSVLRGERVCRVALNIMRVRARETVERVGTVQRGNEWKNLYRNGAPS